MSMSIWIIISWVFVALFTGVNVFVFLKLKKASEQMMKMAFPGAKNMTDALSQMQNMMQGMGKMQGGKGRTGGSPFGPMAGGGHPGNLGNKDAQLKAAMDMLNQLQKGRR